MWKKQGLIGGGTVSAPPPGAPPIAPGAPLACTASELRCVDSAAAARGGALLSPWTSGRGGRRPKDPAGTAADLRKALKALRFREVAERQTAAGPLVAATSPAGDQFEFVARATGVVDFRVRASQAFLSSDGGSVDRAKKSLQRVRDLLFRQFGWSNA